MTTASAACQASRTPSSPHAGDWAKAQLWRELAAWGEPHVAERCAEPATDDAAWSLLDASDGGLEVKAAFVENGDVLVRLFNAEGDATPRRIAVDGRVRRVQMVELDGRLAKELPLQRDAAGEAAVTVTMNRLAVRTLRCSLA